MNPQNITIRFRRLREDAIIPQYKSALAAGLDLAACPSDDLPRVIEPGLIVRIHLGFALAIPAGYEGQVRPRSGLASKHGITLPNAPGTIDADYRGELIVPLINLSDEPFTIEPGMRVAQLIIAPVVHATLIEADELPATERDTAGFGSTGV